MACVAQDFCYGVAMWGGNAEASIPNMGLVPFLVQGPERYEGVGDGRRIESTNEGECRLTAVIQHLDYESPHADGRELVLAGCVEIEWGGQWHVRHEVILVWADVA